MWSKQQQVAAAHGSDLSYSLIRQGEGCKRLEAVDKMKVTKFGKRGGVRLSMQDADGYTVTMDISEGAVKNLAVALRKQGTIGKEDLEIFRIVDDPEEAVAIIKRRVIV